MEESLQRYERDILMRTVVVEVMSNIGNCHIDIEDDNLSDEEAIAQALEHIEENGCDEPARGIMFLYNDDATENEYCNPRII